MSKEERELWNGYEEWLADREGDNLSDMEAAELDYLDQQAYMEETAQAVWGE